MSPRPVDQWNAAKLKSALLDENSELTAQEIAEVRKFIEQIGGLENAQSALELLQELELEDEADDLEGLEEYEDDLDEAA